MLAHSRQATADLIGGSPLARRVMAAAITVIVGMAVLYALTRIARR